ncbi:hypothetical protein [Aliivibrio logei]|uniref:Uncharacterized protein n=1 Tax=Aliivibrio logei TaxID=688 RepID=A0A1B9NW49_ALILO|nr:hypothetical protein [Aliivibrio logei]OCH19097.1 hypothetical protein A6E04_16865 [Aliivibrio logei]
MKKLIEVLIGLAKQYPLHENFNWEIPENCPLDFPDGLLSEFERNIYLKHNLSSFLTVDKHTNRYWVIQEWGGIRSLKKNDRNDALLSKLDLELSKGILTRPTFSVISSLSKVASFIDCSNYAIYDSRVIYSLNWLMFKYTGLTEYYPQPSGRNAELSKFDLNTIFNLSDREITYISHKTAYHNYCNLLKTLSFEMYGKNEPYLAEMLLFSIAPSYIVNDIKKSMTISLKRA